MVQGKQIATTCDKMRLYATHNYKVVSIRRADALTEIDDLAEILMDSVHNGASVGFLAPLSYDEAAAYWNEIAADLGPLRALWLAEFEGRVVGTVQLSLCPKPNGRHRGEVQKLQVHSEFRGHRIASTLMADLETFARENGITLLFLDTISDSPAASIYEHLGWTKAGEIPEYAGMPNGELRPTSYYWKLLK